MSIELTLPAKVGAGASAAAAGSLAIAGGAGAFNGSPTTQVETEQNGESGISNPKTPSANKNFSKEPEVQTTPESTEISNVRSDVKLEPPKPLKTVAEDGSSSYPSETVGSVYKKFLISVNSTKEDSNQSWWSNKFSEFQKKNNNSEKRETGNPFETKPISGYSSDLGSASTSLNAKCDAIYKENLDLEKLKKSTDIHTSGDEEDEEKKTISTWDDLWSYCSNFLAPETIQSSTVGAYPDSSTWGKDLAEKVLVVYGEYNIKFWEVLNQEFFSLEAQNISDEYFKKFRETTTSTDGTIPLKAKCEEIYKLTKNDTPSSTNPSKAAILKYCSLEGK